MHRPLKWRAEQTETGWVQCLSKVLIKPHSKYHWNQTNRSSLKAHRMSMPCNKFALKKNQVWFTSSHHHLKVFLPWLTTSRSFNLAESEQFTQYCKAIYVKFWIPNQAVFFFLSEMCIEKNSYANCMVVESLHKSLLCSVTLQLKWALREAQWWKNNFPYPADLGSSPLPASICPAELSSSKSLKPLPNPGSILQSWTGAHCH